MRQSLAKILHCECLLFVGVQLNILCTNLKLKDSFSSISSRKDNQGALEAHTDPPLSFKIQLENQKKSCLFPRETSYASFFTKGS